MLETSLKDFKKHHQNKLNVFFHIVCGFLYMSLFFNIVKKPFIVIYITVLIYLFPKFLMENILVGFILIFINHLIDILQITFYWKIVFLLIAYMAPELSHWICNEPTVLNINKITFFSIFENFFLLLPWSIYRI